MYKFEELSESSQFTLRVVRDLVDAYALIDKLEYKSQNEEGTFMLCAITPNSHYLQSQMIRDVLSKIATKIKANKEWNIKDYWELLLDIE